MRDSDIYLGLGSNVGNRIAHLRAGLRSLGAQGLDIRVVSSFYLTEPDLGAAADAHSAADHPWYINCVAAVRSAASADDVLRTCVSVERQRGRSRPGEEGALALPRTLDVDILLIGTEVIDRPGLRVPHPRMNDRRFVLQPLAEIAADTRHPTAGATASELLEALPAGEKVWLLAPPPAESP